MRNLSVDAENRDVEDPTADWHPYLKSVAGWLHDMIVGEAAGALLAAPDAIPSAASVWVAPSWAWLYSRIDVGRKDQGRDGTRLRLPVRVSWAGGPIALMPPGPAFSLRWSSAGMGHSGEGELRVLHDDAGTTFHGMPAGTPTFSPSPQQTREQILDALAGLAAQGHASRWELLMWLEPYVERALNRAHGVIAREVARHTGTQRVLVDSEVLSRLADQLLLGVAEGEEKTPGGVMRLLERCMRPTTFMRVDPIRYIKSSVQRDSDAAIRDVLGDPHIGRKVRALAIELGTSNVDEVVNEYRLRHPSDELSARRAIAALSIGADAMAGWRSFEFVEPDESSDSADGF